MQPFGALHDRLLASHRQLPGFIHFRRRAGRVWAFYALDKVEQKRKINALSPCFAGNARILNG
jgi:hypothetical protein